MRIKFNDFVKRGVCEKMDCYSQLPHSICGVIYIPVDGCKGEFKKLDDVRGNICH